MVEEVSEGKKQRGNEISGISTAIHLPLTVKEITFTGAQSYIGFDFAERNLESGDFDEIKDENKALWENMLSRVEIEGDEELKKTFYSCLYRGLLFPHRAYELDAEGRKVHFAPSLGEAREGPRYTDNGFWDTYRTVYPFLSVVYPEVLEEMMEGFLADYLDGGWLPRWSALNGKNCMPSTAIDVVIADLSLKGIIGGELLRKLFEGMEKHALTPAPNDVYGREGVEDYLTLGYIPFDKRELNSVNLTVDASYHDYCLSVVADLLGEKEKAEIYRKRSYNWRNLFDKNSGCLRAKMSDGGFYPDFNPKGWGFEYTEASPLVTTFSSQHDFEGLEELFGGREAFLERLEGLFETENEFYVARWNRAIHEMAEYSEEKWGAVAISNEPSFHIPFIFALLGEKEKASYWVKRIATEAFSYKDDGFPGDEDNGAMALWFCLAVMGIYPVCPGKDIFTVTDKLCERIKIGGRELNLSNCGNLISYKDLMDKIR